MTATKLQEKKLKEIGFRRKRDTYILESLFSETKVTKPRSGKFNLRTDWTDGLLGNPIIKRNLTWKKLTNYCEKIFR